MPLPPIYQVNVVITKFPSSWKDNKLKLMQKKKYDMSMEVLKHHLQIEKTHHEK